MMIGPSEVWQEVCDTSNGVGVVDSQSFSDIVIWEPHAEK